MVNIVGKRQWIPLVLCLATRIYAAPVALKVMALDGAPLESAGVGVPFLVEVTAAGRDTNQKPRIAGLDTFQVQSVGRRVYSVNGEASSMYTYKVRVDRPGTFVIGPATMYIEGAQSQSKAVRIAVGDKQIIDPAYAKKVRADAQDARVQLSVNKTAAYVGERVIITLTFAAKKDKVKLEHIDEPAIPELQIGAKTGPIMGVQTIDGSEYVTMTWSLEMYAQKAGQIIIPAIGADYLVESELSNNLAFFTPFFRVNIERKRTYSNACTLAVQELPPCQGHADAVGVFKRIDASINPAVAQEGEGMVLLLEIEGDGNLAKIPALQLQNMPQSLKWYDSKQYIKDSLGAYGLPVKCFEYIVQGLEQGSWEIPPQSFTYFDVGKRQYVTIKTVPCAVTIKPNPASKKIASDNHRPETSSQVTSQSQDEAILPLNTWSSLRPVVHRKPMPWGIFFLLVMLPVLVGILQGMRVFWQKRASYFKQHFAFKQARKKIQEARRHKLSRNLHIIFIELFSLRLPCAPSLVTQEMIEQALRHAGLSDQEMKAWEQFYTRMYEHAFFDSEFAGNDKDLLFEQSLQWVSKLEHVL